MQVEIIRTKNYDTVISMLDYYSEAVARAPDENWLRLWPQDGWEFMTERIKEFLKGKELPKEAMALVLNMEMKRLSFLEIRKVFMRFTCFENENLCLFQDHTKCLILLYVEIAEERRQLKNLGNGEERGAQRV